MAEPYHGLKRPVAQIVPDDKVRQAMNAVDRQEMLEAQIRDNHRGQCRADAIHAVMRAKERDGRESRPPTSHDADVIFLITDLLMLVSGLHQGAATHPQIVKKTSAPEAENGDHPVLIRGELDKRFDGILDDIKQAVAQELHDAPPMPAAKNIVAEVDAALAAAAAATPKS